MIEAQNLTRSFNGQLALSDLNLRVEPGEIFCLLGANGAGKTTTINLFLHFLRPDSGRALVSGQDVAADPVRVRRLIGYIPENLQLYPHLSGWENLRYFSNLAGKAYEPAELEMFLTEAGLEPSAFHRRIGEYSKGMRQKVGVAVALAKQAKALLLDEPTSGLDPKAANELGALLRTLSGQGVAVLMATHDLFRAKETGHRVGIMKAGRLVETLATTEIGHTDLERLYLTHMN